MTKKKDLKKDSVVNIINTEDIFGGLVSNLDQKYLTGKEIKDNFCNKHPDNVICKTADRFEKPISCFIKILAQFLHEKKINQASFDNAWKMLRERFSNLPEKIDLSKINIHTRFFTKMLARAMMIQFLPVIIFILIAIWVLFGLKKINLITALMMTVLLFIVFSFFILLYLSILKRQLSSIGVRITDSLLRLEKLLPELFNVQGEFKNISDIISVALRGACDYTNIKWIEQ